MINFKFSAVSHYIENLIRLAAGLPAKDYPPANIAAWIKICKEKGRDDLGKKIMNQWNAVVDKYPAVRVNWGAAVKISGHSIKKNVFNHQEFAHWLEAELDVPRAEATQLAHSVPAVPADHHPIEVPAEDETPEDWQHAAKKTAATLSQLHEAFTSTEEMIAYLKGPDGISGLQEKIKKYGPGGEKSTNKDGTPAKMSERVPKWEAQLKEFEAKLEEVTRVVTKQKTRVKKLETDYNNKRITTVKYEEGVQSALTDTMEFILKNVKDPEKQKQMLMDLQKLMKKMEDTSEKAASSNKEAAIWDKFIGAMTSVFEYVKQGWENLVAWAKGLVGKVDDVDSAINPF